jgi:hypothetical protein
MMVQWSSSLLQLMLFLLVHHQILAQMLEHLQHFLHEQWHFCKVKDCHLAKIIIIIIIMQGRFGKLWPKVIIFEGDLKTQFAIFEHVTKT